MNCLVYYRKAYDSTLDYVRLSLYAGETLWQAAIRWATSVGVQVIGVEPESDAHSLNTIIGWCASSGKGNSSWVEFRLSLSCVTKEGSKAAKKGPALPYEVFRVAPAVDMTDYMREVRSICGG